MTQAHSSNLPSDLLEDFRLDAAEQFPRCEQRLIEQERAPKSTKRLRELFRLIHTLKGNLRADAATASHGGRTRFRCPALRNLDLPSYYSASTTCVPR